MLGLIVNYQRAAHISLQRPMDLTVCTHHVGCALLEWLVVISQCSVAKPKDYYLLA